MLVQDLTETDAISGYRGAVRIVIADDHPLMRAALKQAVACHWSDADIVEAASVGELVERLTHGGGADVVLLDLKMPDAQGFSALVRLRGQFPAIPVIVVSATEDAAAVDRALLLGASGYILKSAPVGMVGAGVRSVLEGNVVRPDERSGGDPLHDADAEQFRKLRTLTPQQLNVLVMIAEGESNKAVANRLHITEATVKAHITAVMQKLGVQRRTQAAIVAQRALQLRGDVAIETIID